MCRSFPMARTTTSPELSPTRLHLQAMGAADLFRVAAQSGLHGQSGVTGAHGVVLVGNRGAKERHDTIAHDLVDRAFVAVDGVHHALQGGIQECWASSGSRSRISSMDP